MWAAAIGEVDTRFRRGGLSEHKQRKVAQVLVAFGDLGTVRGLKGILPAQQQQGRVMRQVFP